MSRSRSVLVTGATGFVGRHLIRRLRRDCHAVVALSRSTASLGAGVEVLPVREFGPAGLRAALAGRRFDWVVHLAGAGTRPDDRDAATLFRVNVDATRALTEIAADWPAKAMFVAGSGSEYAAGALRSRTVEESSIEMLRLYGASKAAGTISAVATAHALGLPLAVGRFFNIYGPGEAPHRLLPSLVSRLGQGRRAALSTGRQLRDFLHVDDAVEAIVALLDALERAPAALAVNVATGEMTSVRRFAEIVVEVMGADAALLGFGDLPMRADDMPCFGGDPRLISDYAGWSARHDLRTGIERAVTALVAGLA